MFTVKDGLQLVNYQKLFTKKLLEGEKNVHADFDSKLKQLVSSKSYRLVQEDSNIKIFGGYENSNILQATIQKQEISILLNADTNSNGCTHWFNFKVLTKTDCSYTFKILNNRRPKSLFTRGNHIHTKEAEQEWGNNTTNVFYYRTNINHPYYHSDLQEVAHIQEKVELYTLQFEIQLNANVNTQIAMNLPYTVDDLYKLNKFLESKLVNLKTIGLTPLGLPLIKVKFKPQRQDSQSKQSIVILSRQHPCESSGSHICEALLRSLANNPQLPYHVIVFPMVNPDGVFLGNSRCNWHGVDLNRKWDHPDNTSPEVRLIKKQILKLHSKYPILFLIDLHGHSNEIDQFIYGCIPDSVSTMLQYLQAKLFPRMLHKESPFFSYDKCKFRISPSKKATARVMFFQELGVLNSLTIETSFYGYHGEDNEKMQFTKAIYEQMANTLISCLKQYQDKLDQLRCHQFQNSSLSLKSNTVSMKNQNQFQDDFFSQQELKKVFLSFSRGLNPILKESLPDSDSEAETDIKPKFIPRLSFKPIIKQKEFQPIQIKNFLQKMNSQESQKSEQNFSNKPRKEAQIKKLLTQLNIINYSHSITDTKVPRLIIKQQEKDQSSIMKMKRSQKLPSHNVYIKSGRKKLTQTLESKVYTRLQETQNASPESDRPFLRQHSRSVLFDKQMSFSPSKINGQIRQFHRPSIIVENNFHLENIKKDIPRQHSKSQLHLQNPLIQNLNTYYGIRYNSCVTQQDSLVVQRIQPIAKKKSIHQQKNQNV